MIVQCDYCGKDVKKSPSDIRNKNNVFCSKDCHYKWKSENNKGENNHHFSSVKYNCDYCKDEFLIKPYILKEREDGKRKNIFCSRDCHNKWRKENKGTRRTPVYGQFEIECEYCKDKFIVCNYDKERSKFCSKECSDKSKINRVILKCIQCKEEFQCFPSMSEGRKFCSLKCNGEWCKENNTTKIHKKCLMCGNDYRVSPSWENSFLCSKDCTYEWYKDERYISLRRDLAIKQMKNQATKDTKPERMVKEYLIRHHITYIPQQLFYDKFVVDFYLPDYDIIIEVQGDFWHGNPSVYGDGEGLKPLRESQIKQIKKDELRFECLRRAGHSLYDVWEKDIYENLSNALYFLN